MPAPESVTSKRVYWAAVDVELHGATGRRVLDAVEEQVREHLRDAVRVGAEHRQALLQHRVEDEAVLEGQRLDGEHGTVDHLADVDVVDLPLHAAGFDLGEIDKIVDDVIESVALGDNRRAEAGDDLGLCLVMFLDDLGCRNHRGEGAAKLMRDLREKAGLYRIDLAQLGVGALDLVGPLLDRRLARLEPSLGLDQALLDALPRTRLSLDLRGRGLGDFGESASLSKRVSEPPESEGENRDCESDEEDHDEEGRAKRGDELGRQLLVDSHVPGDHAGANARHEGDHQCGPCGEQSREAVVQGPEHAAEQGFLRGCFLRHLFTARTNFVVRVGVGSLRG
jgi:hypothetical protein